MKPVLTKIAVLLPLVLLAATFVGTGTASAAPASPTSTKVSCAPLQVTNVWYLNVPKDGVTINIYLWTQFCNGKDHSDHCQAVADWSMAGSSDLGPKIEMQLVIKGYNTSGEITGLKYTNGVVEAPDAFGNFEQDVNTPSLGGYANYACVGTVIKP
jgi:hypothetical protein